MSALHDSAASLVKSLHSSFNSLTGLGGEESFSEAPELEGSDLSLEDQLIRLKNHEYQCYCRLKTLVEEANIGRFVNDELILHFAQCSPGEPYDSKTAWEVIRGYDPHNWTLKAKNLLTQLETQTLFPVPDLRSAGDHPMFYMKPSRFVPTSAANEQVMIENLVYVIKSMRELHTRNRTHGLGLIINMNDWEAKNFSKTYWIEFMRILEGKVIPARIETVLIVNPPKKGFDAVYKYMRATLSNEFLEKIHRIPESELDKYLQSDYSFFLPEELANGLVPVDEIVTTWIADRMEKEEALGLEL